jgi:hypothetical protein
LGNPTGRLVFCSGVTLFCPPLSKSADAFFLETGFVSNLTIGEPSCTLGDKTENRSVIEVDVSGRNRNREIGRFATVNRSNRSFEFFISFFRTDCNTPKAQLSRKAGNPFFFCFSLVF